ncbi:MAG: maleylacetoacetate isomerase [Fimbriimonadaceae bacterium]|nr:maleylacetoacetate isomerase [Alphaproteobacteria bacterium]
MLTLWGYFRSSAAYRLRIALNYKNIPHRHKYVHLAKGEQSRAEFLRVNPQGLLPVLELEDGQQLTQSMAILEYLEETCPEPAILPGDAVARAYVRSVADIIACDIHPIDNLRVLKYLRGPLGQDDETVNNWYRHWVRLGFDAIEELIDGDGYCFDGRVSLADICLVPQIFNAQRFKLSLDSYPKIKSVEEVCGALKAFADAHPDAQEDAE